MKAVILAGGRGSRLNEFTKDKNKSMIKLFEKPLIEYNLDHAVDAGVIEIIIVVGYKKEEVIRRIGKKYRGINVSYVVQKQQKGLVHAIEIAKDAIADSDFFLMLADEIVVGAEIAKMTKKFRDEDLFAICGIVYEEDSHSIGKTYTAMVNEKGRAFRLIEKPIVKINNIKGTGHCIMKNRILDYIDRTPINAYRREKELVDLIQVAIDDGKDVYIYPITKNYVNVNTKEDFDLAKELIKKGNPKVLIVHNQMKHYGGAELLIVELANWMTKMGIKNDILALSKSKEVENDLINTKIITPNHNIDLRPPGYKNMQDIFNAIRVFRRKLSEIEDNYDVINFHDFPVTWTLWPRKKPAVWFMNLPPNLWSKPEAGWFLKLVNKVRIGFDRFVVTNSMDVITVAEVINKIRAKKRYGRNSILVDFGVNYDYFSKGNKNNAIKKWPKIKNKFIVMHSGQITDVKNQITSIMAISEVKDKIPNILIIFAGTIANYDYKNGIDDFVKKNKLESHILFTGNLDRNDLRDLYKASDIGLFPIKGQGGVLAPFEVVCAGAPIIVSEDIETASFIKKNNLGIITKDYEKAIMDIYNNKEKYKKAVKETGRYIRDNLSWKRYTERMIEAFKMAWKKYK